jgi:hypothetical protein
MKKQLSFLILIIALAACKKDTSSKPASIAGTWQWLSTTLPLPISSQNPSTPASTGITRTLVFKTNTEWYLLENSIKIDSGTYATGYGEFTPYQGAYIYQYDSVRYFRLGDNRNISDAYIIRGDTLTLSGGLRGNRVAPYIAENGAMKWKKQ